MGNISSCFCDYWLILPDEGVISAGQLITIILSIGLIVNFIVSTLILINGEIKQVNVTYVCPTVRKFMSEQEIKEIEGSENNNV